MKLHFYPAILIAVAALLAGSCNIINPAEKTPTYVRIDSIEFVNSPTVGTASQKIRHAYIYYNNQSLGAYDLPCTIPVLTEAAGGRLQVLPGVDLNGLGGISVIYPFFQGDTMTIPHAPGQIIPLQPRTRYTSAARLIWSDAFDGNTQFRYYTGADSLGLTTAPGEVFEGTGSGKIHLPAGAGSSESATPFYVSIPLVPSNDSYIELNYKGSAVLEVGMATTTSSGPYTEYFIAFRPRADWNKVYIQTRTFVSQHIGQNYNILLRAVQPEGSTAGGDVFVDNLKVVSF